jgi:hypothetical protein
MNPQKETLTHRQLRFIITLFMLALLAFGGVVGGIAWKGNQVREANRKIELVQLEGTKNQNKKSRVEAKKHPPKKGQHKMPNPQIAQGVSGSFPAGTHGYTSTTYNDWEIRKTGVGLVASADSPNDWQVSLGAIDPLNGHTTATVLVPIGAQLGEYQIALYDPTPREDNGRYNFDDYQFFDVIEGTPVDPVDFPGAGWYGTGSCTAAQYGADGNATHTMAGGIISEATGVWGGNANGPHDDPCGAMAVMNTGFTPGWYRHPSTGSVPCPTPVHITTALQYVTFFCGCGGAEVLGGSGPYATEGEASLTAHTRYKCVEGELVTQQLCEFDPEFNNTSAFPLDCGSTPIHTRYRCNDAGVCEAFLTIDPDEGFETCAEANCQTVPYPPTPTPYTRYVCAIRAGVSSCVEILTNDPTEGFESCEDANCAGVTPPPPVATYTRYRCNDAGQCVAFETTVPTAGYDTCAGVDCTTEPPATVFWCVGTVCHSGTNPPQGAAVFGSCEEANCNPITPATVFWCINNVIQSGTNPPADIATYPTYQACHDAGCHAVQPTSYYWCVNGTVEPSPTQPAPNAIGPFSSAPDCNNITPPVDPIPGDCTYYPYALTVSRQNDALSGDHLELLLHAQGGDGGTNSWNSGWTVTLLHFIDNVAQPAVEQAYSSYPIFRFVAPATPGVHHFEAEFTKPGCTDQIAEANFSVGTATDTGGGGGGGNCPPCPPEPDAVVCNPTIVIQKPDGGELLQNFVRVRVAISDANEQTNPCHHNYPRIGNFEDDRPALQLFVGEYQVLPQWKKISGTPLNGIYEALVDTRDFSNGARVLHASMRGVGGCRKSVTRAVTLANTLQGNIFYRDTFCAVNAGYVVGDACIGAETRALEENTSRRYWEQWGVRSGTALDGPYQHADWPKHQMVLPVLGASYAASGKRFERRNYSAHVTFRLPLAREVRFRRKWTPQFYLSCFDLDAETVAKIRPIAQGRHYAFTTNPARVWMYDGKGVQIYGDFSVNPVADEDELGEDEQSGDFPDIDLLGSNIFAPDAIDCAVLGGEATGDKVYVVVPPGTDLPNGEVFAFDPDEDSNAVEYGIRREKRVPRFIEAVGGRIICLYVHDEGVSLPSASNRTRAYDLTFKQPALLWQLASTATFAGLDGDTLFVACGHRLYSTTGATAPTLVREFAADVSAASKTFVGLVNGEVWKKGATGWVRVLSRAGAIGGVTSWNAGTVGEAQTDAARGVCAGDGERLSGERSNGTWMVERELVLPVDLDESGKSVERVTALDLFSLPVDTPAGADDAETLPQRDERLLVGTAESGLLFVYQRSALSEQNGAIAVSHDSVPRVFPFPRRAPVVTT